MHGRGILGFGNMYSTAERTVSRITRIGYGSSATYYKGLRE